MRTAAYAADGPVREAPLPAPAVEAADPGLSRETLVRWSGVACLYAGTAAALACLWSPV